MICSECYEIFTVDAIEIGELFNCSPDTSVVCSEKCEKKLRERVANGTWMEYRGFPGKREDVSENFE